MSLATKRTPRADRFLQPVHSTHRQYDALRAYFVEGLPAAGAAARFGYTPGSFRVLVHPFRHGPQRALFLAPAPGPRTAPKKDRLRDRVVALRKQNRSIYDLSATLRDEGPALNPAAASAPLKAEGFARLPRRLDEERPPGSRPTAAAAAVRHLDLSPRSFRTQFGGVFLSLPSLAAIPFDRRRRRAGFPGSEMVPAGCALRPLLALKRFGTARHAHVMRSVLDEGLALCAGRNVIPPRPFLTEYSCRIGPACYPNVLRSWFDALTGLRLPRGSAFDLDFHTIPCHGNDAPVEKHYVPKRSRRQQGLLAFLVHDAEAPAFCYADADLRKEDQDGAARDFARRWEQRTGHYPQELIFDSRLTTEARLNDRNRLGIHFIARRRRSPKALRATAALPAAAWRQVELKGVSRLYRAPRVLDRRVTLPGYDGPPRQLTVMGLGHAEPTLLLSNHLTPSPARLLGRYAQRMLIENRIEAGIDFFHLDALASAVALGVNWDRLLTLMASSR
jgi:hypothetical protein